MQTRSVTAATFDTHNQADEAIRKLKSAGFDMQSLSVVGKDYRTEDHAIGFYNAGDRMKLWGKSGAFWGGLFGILFSPALFLIPGIGHIIVLGPIVSMIVSGLEGATVVGGISALAGGLASIGIPKDSIVQYETQIKAGKFLVIAQGTAEEVERAREILGSKSSATSVQHA
jgi:uncharacterized membrane protein